MTDMSLFSGAIPPKFSTINWHAGHANSNASGSCDGYVTFSCALNSTFLHLRASKIWILWRVCRFFGRNTNSSEIECIRILWPACRFFGCYTILMSLQKSDTPVTRSGSISKSKYLEFERIRILSQVSRFFVCSNSRFSTNMSMQNSDLVTSVLLFPVLQNPSEIECIRIQWQVCRFLGCNTIQIFQQKSDAPVTRIRMHPDPVTGMSLVHVR